MNLKQTNTTKKDVIRHSGRIQVIPNKALYPEMFTGAEPVGRADDFNSTNFIILDKFVSVESTIDQANLIFNLERDVYFKFEQDDPYCKESTTAEAIWNLLEKFIKLFFIISQATKNEHCQLFQVIYNTTQKVYRLIKLLKQFWQSPKLKEVLVLCVKAIESSSILMRPKYIEWKVKLDLG